MLHIKRMALRFGTAMYGIMFGARMRLVIFGICRSLHTFYYSYSHAGSQIRVFTESLLSPSPTRITEDIHIRIPEGKSFVSISISVVPMCLMKFGTGLITYGCIYPLDGFIIESRRHPHCDRKYRCQSVAGNTM